MGFKEFVEDLFNFDFLKWRHGIPVFFYVTIV